MQRCLKQLDLGFRVTEGYVLITSQESLDQSSRTVAEDAFHVVGHCLLAFIAAGLGGLAGPFVCDLARKARRGKLWLLTQHPLIDAVEYSLTSNVPGTARSPGIGPNALCRGKDRKMRSVRFTIAWLMTVVLVLAIGLAALRYPAGFWAEFMQFLTPILCMAVFGAI